MDMLEKSVGEIVKMIWQILATFRIFGWVLEYLIRYWMDTSFQNYWVVAAHQWWRRQCWQCTQSLEKGFFESKWMTTKDGYECKLGQTVTTSTLPDYEVSLIPCLCWIEHLVASIRLFGCLSIRAVKGKWLELSTSNSVNQPMCALTLRSKGQDQTFSSPFALAL